MKIGILGGTFNPPHIGHLILAQTLTEKLKLNKFFLIPTNMPPHKNTYLIDAKHRLNMVKLAIENNPTFELLDWEVKRGGISYTIDTVKELKKKFPQDEFFLIMGSDLANDFYTWKHYREIKRLVKIVIAKREIFPIKKKNSFFALDIIQINITSSLVREYIRKGVSVRYLIPEKVFGYIKKNRLYRK